MIKTKEEIEKLLASKGGYTRKSLESLGVEWPPQKGWKKKLLGKKTNRRKNTYQKRRSEVLLNLRLNEYSTNAGVCLSIHKKTGWPMPGKKAEYQKYITKYWRSISNTDIAVKRKPRTIKDFYNSKQWKELRYAALSLCEGKCQLCGASAADGAKLHVDHVKPRSTHPELELDLDNLGVLCEDCNFGKMNYDDFDYRNKF